MRDQAENRRLAFKAWLGRTRQNVATVARESGVPQTTLYSFLAGKSASLKATTEAQVARSFNVTVDELFGGASPALVGVIGKVGAGAEIYPMQEASGEPAYAVELPPTVDPAHEYLAFEIEGFSMPPARPGWVIIFRARSSPPEEMLGYPVLVDLIDGRRLFKTLRRGYEQGRFNLESWDGSEPIENIPLQSVHAFVAMTPGKMAR